MTMSPRTAMRKIEEINDELMKLEGRCDRSTRMGKTNHNRRSTLYGRRKRMMLIIVNTLAPEEKE